jgi:hypothetical protein
MPIVAIEMRSLSADGVGYATFHVEERIEGENGWKRKQSIDAVSGMPEARQTLVLQGNERVIIEGKNDTGLESVRSSARVRVAAEAGANVGGVKPSATLNDDEDDGPSLFEDPAEMDAREKRVAAATEAARARLAEQEAQRSANAGPSTEQPSVAATDGPDLKTTPGLVYTGTDNGGNAGSSGFKAATPPTPGVMKADPSSVPGFKVEAPKTEAQKLNTPIVVTTAPSNKVEEKKNDK